MKEKNVLKNVLLWALLIMSLVFSIIGLFDLTGMKSDAAMFRGSAVSQNQITPPRTYVTVDGVVVSEKHYTYCKDFTNTYEFDNCVRVLRLLDKGDIDVPPVSSPEV